MFFRMIYDEKLAQAAYLIGCQQVKEAIVIDPQRDVKRYIELASKEGFTITAITETHIHADFLSGARELAELTSGRLYLSDEGDVDWKYLWLNKKKGGGSYNYQLLKHGDSFKIGKILFKALHTPGHTPEHICFLVTDLGGGATEPIGITTGDFVFVGSIGRPDLLETAAGQAGKKEESAKQLYKSVQNFTRLPDYLQVWPGHGAGSACGKALGAIPQSTVGYEKRFNPSICEAENEGCFIQSILDGQPEPPYYFARMKYENKTGPALLGELPQPTHIKRDAIANLRSNDITILDTRPWEDYCTGHLPGALHTPLDNAFPTVVGSYVEPGFPIYLIVEDERVKEAVNDLIRIGLDEITGYIRPHILSELAGENKLISTFEKSILEFPTTSKDNDNIILDVRNPDEFKAGHLPNAKNIAYTRLLPRLNELPPKGAIFLYCHTGIRSGYAAGFLQKYGFDVTLLTGGYEAWVSQEN